MSLLRVLSLSAKSFATPLSLLSRSSIFVQGSRRLFSQETPKPSPRDVPKARLIEIFSAIQGEGSIVGTRQIFVRFAICDLRCRYCDSSHTWKSTKTCSIEQAPGSRSFETHTNPVDIDTLISWIERQHNPKTLHDSISFTGGEPLLHAKFLMSFLPKLKEKVSLPIYLETAGHRPELLNMVIPHLDMIGMDMKLPSVSGEKHWKAHAEFLKICVDAKKDVFVKMIVSKNTTNEDLTMAAQIIKGVSASVPTYLQPVSKLKEELPSSEMTSEPVPNADISPDPAQVLLWQQLMKEAGLKSVMVIPQTHKFINQM
eukprot:TRINITY_DN8146_c0_g1_i1.p1 TRINITY_DN8146_c0_g1~~TRINITY_DN8146_c0_g1_i1.p1  ORF type:complete len:314 (+),score=68.47 TRINITY_DN8146_c0_g1_i1:52-993(+)